MSRSTASPSSQSSNREVNDELWAKADLVKEFAHRRLRPPEEVILSRYRDELSVGGVLELGCGAGRLTGHLCDISERVHGIDISPLMLDYCRQNYPDATFSEADLRDLSAFEADPFAAVFAPFNVLGVLDDAERKRALDGIHRVLTPGGLLVFSSHNLGYAAKVHGPVMEIVARTFGGNPVAVARGIIHLRRGLRNHRRLREYERVLPEYAILNDPAHDYTLLHYYISRDSQARQLAEHGFRLLECIDLDGDSVEAGELAPACYELHYVARRAGRGSGCNVS